MCPVHRNRTLSRRYIRNVYVYGKNAIQTVHKKCVLCTETEHFPDGTSEMCMCTEKTLFKRYIRNVSCAQKQNTFQIVHQKCVLCTETEHFPDGTSENVLCTETKLFPDATTEMCTVHRNGTLSRRYT